MPNWLELASLLLEGNFGIEPFICLFWLLVSSFLRRRYG